MTTDIFTTFLIGLVIGVVGTVVLALLWSDGGPTDG